MQLISTKSLPLCPTLCSTNSTTIWGQISSFRYFSSFYGSSQSGTHSFKLLREDRLGLAFGQWHDLMAPSVYSYMFSVSICLQVGNKSIKEMYINIFNLNIDNKNLTDLNSSDNRKELRLSSELQNWSMNEKSPFFLHFIHSLLYVELSVSSINQDCFRVARNLVEFNFSWLN